MNGSRWFGPAIHIAMLSAASAGALEGCSSAPTDAPTASAASSTSSGDAPFQPTHSWTDCLASDQSFVRRVLLGVNGRRTWGQAEVNAYEDAIHAIRAANIAAQGPYGAFASTGAPVGGDLEPARKLVVEAMMREDAFRERWSDFLMDALHVVRIETKSQKDCYGEPSSSAIDDGSLAAYVRDGDANTDKTPPIASFTMRDLVSSSLALDDVSPVYRAHLFAMMSRPYTAANVAPPELEAARRDNFGAVFDSAYVHRDLVCLACHNSEFSVTFSADPAKNRAWPVPGLFETALYGASNGKHAPEEAATKGSDERRARSMLRYMSVGDGDGLVAPYGWNGAACGAFNPNPPPDPLGVDTYFASLRSTPEDPTKGLRSSVWDLERALHRGIDALAAHGLERLGGGTLADPDEAFAYLVAENVVEKVWNEVIGTRLTIANYFPRTKVQRDVLESLTERFVASHFSLKSLLLAIVAHPAFNLKAPEEGCGTAAYELPTLFDPWTTSEGAIEKRGNSPADGIYAISARPLRRSLHRAMEWPSFGEYPEGTNDEALEVAFGFFLKDGEPGFRGLDFQGRLTWEATYASCTNPAAGDVITKIVDRAAVVPNATVGEAIAALKDRLIGEPYVEPTVERPLLEALVKISLDDQNLDGLDAKLRSVCGVLVSTPAFMLGGLAPSDTRVVPRLTPTDIEYARTCGYVASDLAAHAAPFVLTCSDVATKATKAP